MKLGDNRLKENVVYIVDDDQDFRESLAWLLDGAGYRAVGFASGEDFLAALDELDSIAREDETACLLLDVRMGGMSGLVLQQRLNERASKLPVIMITGHGDVAMAVQAMKNKAVDFIEKPFDDEALLSLVAATLKVAEQQHRQDVGRLLLTQRWCSLSKRERQVADLVLAGRANREVAEQLSISIKTVEVHRSRVMSKMQAKNVAELVSLASNL